MAYLPVCAKQDLWFAVKVDIGHQGTKHTVILVTHGKDNLVFQAALQHIPER